MARLLMVPDGHPRALAPTTTVKFARRMLAASRAAADLLPTGLYGSPGLDILLALYVAEDDAQYLAIGELAPPGSLSPATTARWTRALVQFGYAETRGDLIALTTGGYAKITALVESIYAVQRSLD